MRVVLDSNVVVAGFRSRNGASFRLLELLNAKRFEIAVSVPLVLEYEAQLVRHADLLGMSNTEAEVLSTYCANLLIDKIFIFYGDQHCPTHLTNLSWSWRSRLRWMRLLHIMFAIFVVLPALPRGS